VHPDDLKQLSDLAKFPFTTKQDLRQLPLRHVRRAARAGGAHPRLSGTTGKPTVVGYTQNDIDVWADLDGALDPRRRRRPATSCTSPTATACSPAASARTTAPSGSAAR
jgi:hypothetical protein